METKLACGPNNGNRFDGKRESIDEESSEDHLKTEPSEMNDEMIPPHCIKQEMEQLSEEEDPCNFVKVEIMEEAEDCSTPVMNGPNYWTHCDLKTEDHSTTASSEINGELIPPHSIKQELEQMSEEQSCSVVKLEKIEFEDPPLNNDLSAVIEQRTAFGVYNGITSHIGKAPSWMRDQAEEGCPLICKICGLKFRQKISLNKHYLVHKIDGPHSCSHCNKTFTTSSGLMDHELVHTRVKINVCAICNKSFVSKSSLDQHMLLHMGNKLFTCKVCSKTFSSTYALNAHCHVHGENKPHKCQECGKGFMRKSKLEIHYKVHDKEKAQVCHLCNIAFKLKSDYLLHIGTHSLKLSS